MSVDGRYLVVPEGCFTWRYTNSIQGSTGQLREDPAIDVWYDRFETLNDQFIKAVSDWQKNDEDEKGEDKDP